MKTTTCLYSSRAALYRVFVSQTEAAATRSAPALSPGMASIARSGLRSVLSQTPIPAARANLPAAARCLSTTPSLRLKRTYRDRNLNAGPDRLPQDLEIKDQYILLWDDKGQQTGPYVTRKVIDSIDMTVDSLRMIHPRVLPKPQKKAPEGAVVQEDEAPKQNKGKPEEKPRPAICRIVNKQEARQAELKKQKEKKERAKQAGKQKEVEISWAIAENDLALKLRRLTEFLDKGWRVDVSMAKKKGANKASEADMTAVVKAVEEVIKDTGARERSPRMGAVGKAYKMFLERQGGPREDKSKSEQEKDAEE